MPKRKIIKSLKGAPEQQQYTFKVNDKRTIRVSVVDTGLGFPALEVVCLDGTLAILPRTAHQAFIFAAGRK